MGTRVKHTAIQFMTVLDTQTDCKRIADDSISALKVRLNLMQVTTSKLFRKSAMHKARGFTLVEMIAAITILMILTGMAIPLARHD